jgi:putative membrane protein
MKTSLLFAAVFYAAATPSVKAQDQPPTRPTDSTAKPGPSDSKPANPHEAPAPVRQDDFLLTAAKGGESEVKIASLALRRGGDDKVKELARMLVKDHTAANKELQTIAETLNVKVTGLADPAGEAKLAALNGKAAREFDKAFLDEMAMCHEKDIALFEAGKKVAKSDKVTAFIDKTLPVLKAHAEKIQSLSNNGVKGGMPAKERKPATH